MFFDVVVTINLCAKKQLPVFQGKNIFITGGIAQPDENANISSNEISPAETVQMTEAGKTLLVLFKRVHQFGDLRNSILVNQISQRF